MFRLGLWASVSMIGIGLPAATAVAQDAMGSEARLKMMMECDSIKSESIRLTCYDNAVRSGRTSLGADRLGMKPGSSAAQPLTPEQRFGLTPKLEIAKRIVPDRPLEVDEINARVAAATSRSPGMWRITFADGARWQFLDSALDFNPPRQGEEVRIRKAALGSYLMYVGKQPSVRVARVN